MTHQAGSRGIYFVIFGALMVLTFATVWVATIDLGELNAVVALLIAGIKATLVIFFFMHLKGSSALTKMFLAAGIFWLLILFALSLSDYLSRHWQQTPHGW